VPNRSTLLEAATRLLAEEPEDY